MAATTKSTESPYAELRTLVKEAATLGSIGSLLGWDQETYMPPAAAAHRAEQQALVSGLVHERSTSPRIGELLNQCESDRGLTSDPEAAANLREMRRDYDLLTKLPTELVEELARTGSLAQEAWKEARKNNDFPAFAPWLEKMMSLTRRKAECLGIPKGGAELYDALLDMYEPGMTSAQVDAIFTPLRDRLSRFIADVTGRGTEPDTSALRRPIPADRQHAFGQQVLRAMGFDLEAGRLDTTTHPFCSGMAPGDTRLTTRYRDETFTDALYGTMHEAGHGLYEQGLPKLGKNGEAKFGEPLGESISLGIHESQSRMWENMVGRSREFWVWALPKAREAFAPALDGVSADQMYRAVNTCRPSFIRVEADESTYNLHVMLRFELERGLISGAIKVSDLPREWNSRFKRYLGVDVPDDRRGCLQDVHWSFGLIGYFPTYTLGNLYAAQFWETIQRDIPDLKDRIAKGEMLPLREWLRENIHKHGKRYRAGELCERVTGKPLSADPFMRYLEGKIRPIYGV